MKRTVFRAADEFAVRNATSSRCRARTQKLVQLTQDQVFRRTLLQRHTAPLNG